jgi:hypothetical protein
MSGHHARDDTQTAFRILMAVIPGIVVLGVLLLIAVVLTYRLSPGRNFPFVESSPTATPAHTQLR